MSFRLYTGAANAGTSDAVRDEIMRCLGQRRSVVLLLPSDPDVSRAITLFAAEAPVGLALRTFDRYLDGLWATHGDGRAIATPVQRRAIVEESVRMWTPSTSALTEPRRGMKTLLGTLVQRAAEGPPGLDAGAFPRGIARDLAGFVRLYHEILAHSHLIERAEAHRVLPDLVPATGLPELLVADGFTGFTSGQERFLVTASARTDVVATLTYDPMVPATSAAAELVGRLEAVAARTHLVRENRPADELQRIERGLGTVGSDDIAARGAVVLSEAWGSATEAARIVREAQDALSSGLRPEEIAVVFRDAAAHMNDIRQAFHEAGIPVEIDARLPFRAVGLGRALMLALRIDALDRGSLLDLLRSPYANVANEVLDRFDAASRRASAPSPKSWFRRNDPDTAAFLARASAARDKQVGAEAERAWYSLVCTMMRNAGQARAEVDVRADAGAARAFMEAIQSLTAMGEKRLDLVALSDVLEQTSVVVGSHDRPGYVQVMGAERVRGRRYGCVILGGLTAGEFPRIQRETALSEPAVAASFAEAGIDLAPRSGLAEERLLFYLAATRATDRLVLSRQTHDADGRALRPSALVEEVLDLYRHPVTREYFAGEPPVHVLGLNGLTDAEWAPHTHRRQLRSIASDPQLRAHAPADVIRRSTRQARQALSEAARTLMAERERFSASEIEAYLTCPYLWCVQRLVQPRELDERLDQRVVGQLGHDIMRHFYEVWRERTGTRRVEVETIAAARALHAEVAATCISRVRPETAADAVACRSVARRTLGIVEADTTLLPGFEPFEHEWSFGLGEDDSPARVGRLALAGRVDRIDTDGVRLVLTDYKSGSIGPEHGASKFAERGLVQLALYAEVASVRLGLQVAGGVYRSFKGGKPRGFIRDDITSGSFVRTDVVGGPDDVRRLLDETIALAEDAVDRIRTGDIRPDPRGGVCPPYCPAAAFCEEWRPKRG